jgi:hypothetical protein
VPPHDSNVAVVKSFADCVTQQDDDSAARFFADHALFFVNGKVLPFGIGPAGFRTMMERGRASLAEQRLSVLSIVVGIESTFMICRLKGRFVASGDHIDAQTP